MHCVLLADLAALISQTGPAILYRREVILQEAVTRYWVASRSRLDLWHQVITRNRLAHQDGDWLRLQRWWNDHLPVLEEILVSEMLTRVVAALADGLDQERSERMKFHHESTGIGVDDHADLSPVTHAIHLGHLEVRNRVQFLMLNNRGCRVADAVRLNRLRQATERWTDTLLGRMSVRHHDTVRYAFDRPLARQHAGEAREGWADVGFGAASALMNAAMHDALMRRMHPGAALPQANRQVCQSVMMLFGRDLFDGHGWLKSLGLHRIEMDPIRGATGAAESIPDTGEDSDQGAGLGFAKTGALQRWYLA